MQPEKASIDEGSLCPSHPWLIAYPGVAFIDFTIPIQQEILMRHPNLTSVPQSAPQGLDTPLPPPPSMEWHSFTNLVPIHPESQITADPDPESTLEGASPRLAPQELRPDPDHPNEGQVTWHDVALNIAAGMLWNAREAIRKSLGYTTSAGLARNKFLAKVKFFL
jgi:DNA polymerase eta